MTIKRNRTSEFPISTRSFYDLTKNAIHWLPHCSNHINCLYKN